MLLAFWLFCSIVLFSSHAIFLCELMIFSDVDHFSVTLMITTDQKPTVDTQNIKRRESKHTITKNHQFTKEDSMRGKKNNGTK